MKQPTDIYVKLTTDEKEKTLTISEIFQLIYFSSLLIGIFISFFYYFSIEIWPSLSDSSVIGYLFGVFGVGLLMAIVLTIFFIVPSLLFTLHNPSEKYQWSYFFSLGISWIGLLFLINCKCTLWVSPIAFILFVVAFGFHFCLSLINLPNKLINALIHYLLTPLFLLFPLLFIKTFELYINDNHKLITTTCVIAIISLLINGIYIKYFNSKNSLKKNIGIAIIVISITSLIFSAIPIALKAPNPLITRPFELLKFGSYKAELKFKNDFINQSNPFSFNDNNDTNNTFFILSSVGDEYIFQETFPTYIDINKTLRIGHILDINTTEYWFNNNDNNKILYYDKNLTSIANDANYSIIREECLEASFQCAQIYRIKKENIAFERIVKDSNKSTVWQNKPIEHKKVLSPPPIKPKVKADCNTTISKQTCYCSYPNNN